MVSKSRTITLTLVILLLLVVVVHFYGNPMSVFFKDKPHVLTKEEEKAYWNGIQVNVQGAVDRSASNAKSMQAEEKNVGTSVTEKESSVGDFRVNVVSSVPTGSQTHRLEDCVPLPKSPTEGIKICVHSMKDDQWVSGAFRNGQLWEQDLIYAMMAALKTDPDMQLLDLGSNIGEFTLFAAAMGRRVLAVDMLPNNVLALQTALKLDNLSHLVTIVQNALYRDRRTFGIKEYKGNIGGTALDEKHTVPPGGSNNAVKTITLDDLLPYVDTKQTAFMKLDIETSEHHAIAGGQNFLAAVDVQFIQMEWNSKPPAVRKELVDILSKYDYMASKQALVYSPVDVLNFEGNMNVYFVKRKVYLKNGQLKA